MNLSLENHRISVARTLRNSPVWFPNVCSDRSSVSCPSGLIWADLSATPPTFFYFSDQFRGESSERTSPPIPILSLSLSLSLFEIVSSVDSIKTTFSLNPKPTSGDSRDERAD